MKKLTATRGNKERIIKKGVDDEESSKIDKYREMELD